jgi:hypothetical protein
MVLRPVLVSAYRPRVRCALVLVLLCGVADADRDCTVFDEKATVATDLGCFETLRWDDDYAYGTRVCLIRSAANVCSGVVFLLEGPPRFEAQILDRVTCSDVNAITFKGTWVACDMASRCTHTPLTFKGALADDRLSGTFTLGEDTAKVRWKRSRKKLDTRARVRAQCKRKRPAATSTVDDRPL